MKGRHIVQDLLAGMYGRPMRPVRKGRHSGIGQRIAAAKPRGKGMRLGRVLPAGEEGAEEGGGGRQG